MIAKVTFMNQCPDAHGLRDYATGRIEPGQAARISDHLRHCENCNAAVTGFERDQQSAGKFKGLLQLLTKRDRNMVSPPSVTTRWPNDGSAKDGAALFAEREAIERDCEVEILDLLGCGAFARVYLAQELSMRRRVALKASGRRSDEASLLSSLDHPHIVRVFSERNLADCSLHLLFMQYVPGGNLWHVIERLKSANGRAAGGRLLMDVVVDQLLLRGEERVQRNHIPEPAGNDWGVAACWIGARLADALRYSHGHGVLHRDIKPANVLLTSHGQPMLADFNLSFATNFEGADAGDDFGGTLSYMSPEQLETLARRRTPESLTAASDMYSFGLLLWELATGERPFGNENRKQGLDRIQEAIDRRSAIGHLSAPKDLPQGLRTTIEWCLADDPDIRSVDAARVARRLQIATMPQVEALLHPAHDSWEAVAARWPLATMSLCGLVPNVVISLVNIRFNNAFLVSHVPRLKDDEPWFNVIVFPLATAILLGIAWRAAAVVRSIFVGELLDHDSRCFAAMRLLNLGFVSERTILIFWAISGVVFPMASFVRGANISIVGFAVFFASQIVHGLMAASISHLLISWVTTGALVPRLLEDQAPELEPCLKSVEAKLNLAHAVIGMASPVALILVTLFQSFAEALDSSLHAEDQRSSQMFLLLSLGTFGAIGCGLSLVLRPLISQTFDTLSIAVRSTEDMLYREASGWRPY